MISSDVFIPRRNFRTKFGIFSLSREENDYIELTEVCLAILDLI